MDWTIRPSANDTMLNSDKTAEDSNSKQATSGQPSSSLLPVSSDTKSEFAKETMSISSDEILANSSPVAATPRTSTSSRIDDPAPQTLDQHGAIEEHAQTSDPQTQTTAAEVSSLNDSTTSEDPKAVDSFLAPVANDSTSWSAGPSLTSTGQEAVTLQAPEYVSQPDIEVDLNRRTHDSGADSAIGSMPASSTVSLRESVFNYVEENGRTYHAFHAGKYIGPNDEREQERLDLQHHLFLMTLDNKLHLAPLQNPQCVLGIATGTGIWAIQFAEEYPSADVLGTDLSPIQPTYIPPNCSFEINDAEEEWTYSQPFNYIHGRALVSCFANPPSVISSIFASLAPGGYFELQDPIMPLRSLNNTLARTALDEFQASCMQAAALLGRPWTNGKNYGRWLREAGFVDVHETSYYWATNSWVRGKKQKIQARWLQENLMEGLPAWGLSTLSRGLGWSRERIEALIALARADLRNPDIHAYAECYVVYGRKPGGEETQI